MASNGFLIAFINHHSNIYLLLQITVHHKGGNNPLSSFNLFLSINTVCETLWAVQIASGHCKSIYCHPMNQSQLHLWLRQKVQQYLCHFVPMETVHYLMHIALKQQIPAENSPARCYELLGLHG